jgi:hypothetical protein
VNIGLDIDDTITKAPAFFKLLSKAVRKAGGKVHVISSRTAQPDVLAFTKEELQDHGIEYDSIYLLPSSAEAKAKCPHKDLDWYQQFIWQKIQYCLDRDIGVYFDDEVKVVELFNRLAPQVQVFMPCWKR